MPTEPGGTLGFVQLTGPEFGQVQVPPPVVTAATDTNVVFVGVNSVNLAVLQLLGPRLVTVWVYVMFVPAVTGLGLPLLVTPRSQFVLTFVTTVVVLVFTELTAFRVDVAVMVPARPRLTQRSPQPRCSPLPPRETGISAVHISC